MNICNICGQYVLDTFEDKTKYSKNILCECIKIKETSKNNICNIS